MSTLTQAPPTSTDQRDDRTAWLPLLAWATGIAALADVAFMMYIAEVIPPFAVGAVLTVVGVVLLRRRPSAGIVLLGLTSLVLLLGSLPFAIDHLPHPESGLDFTHAVIGTLGRLVAIIAAAGAWRGAAAAMARRSGVAAIGLAALTVLVAGVATTTTAGADLADGDVEVPVVDAAFPDPVVATVGDTLFIDNGDPFRHTFTVEGTDIDVELPAWKAARIEVDLPVGTYPLICEIPGHEFMVATLEVR